MIAVDTNILVYAHRRDSPWNHAARRRIRELAEGADAWAIPWPCVHEFLGVVTHPRICHPPTPVDGALQQVEVWMESPTLVLLAECGTYWRRLSEIVRQAGVGGSHIHDARIAALCREHGISTLWSADRDFSRFAGVKIVNPLLK